MGCRGRVSLPLPIEGELRYVTSYGGVNIVSLQSPDLYATVKANADREVKFTLDLQPQR
jgi:hypothetical protein